jgi:hypothetical protein
MERYYLRIMRLFYVFCATININIITATLRFKTTFLWGQYFYLETEKNVGIYSNKIQTFRGEGKGSPAANSRLDLASLGPEIPYKNPNAFTRHRHIYTGTNGRTRTQNHPPKMTVQLRKLSALFFCGRI